MSKSVPDGGLLVEGYVLCDEIRQENNGKFLLIGVYSDTIGAPRYPVTLATLSIAMKVRVLEPGHHKFALEVKDTDHQMLGKAEGGFSIGAQDIIWMPLTFRNILLARPGEYSMVMTLGDNPPLTFKFKAIQNVNIPQIVGNSPPSPPN